MVAIFTELKSLVMNHNASTVYDILRPIFYCSIPFGLTQFNIRKAKFKNCTLLLLYNSVVIIVSTSVALIALNSRLHGDRISMHDIADSVLGWSATINIEVIIIFGCIFRTKVI